MNETVLQKLDILKIDEEIKKHPRVRERVREVLLFDRVESTNQVAMKMGSAGHPGGLLILAEGQEKGRGRLNRTWVSPKGVNLYVSLLLRPYQPQREFPLFSLATAVGLTQAIRSATGLPAVVKWPNDILVNDKKVAGILLETGRGGGDTPYLVVGMGVNVNWTNVPPELPEATSLQMALGQPMDRNRLLQDMLIALAEQYHLLDAGKADLIIQSLSEACVTLGKKVRVDTPDKVLVGVAETILRDGGLTLRMGDQSVRKILLGDITHLQQTQ